MGRIPRWRLGQGVYHVLNRGINNVWIFSADEERDYFIELLVKVGASCKINVYHWVVMNNHFHLALEVMDVSELSYYVGKVSSLYSQYWHGKHGCGRGPIWQGRFKSIPVQKDGYLMRLGRYIERNPVVTGIKGVILPSDYKWSSAAAYVLGTSDPLVNVESHPYWALLGEDEKLRRKHYKKLLMEKDDEASELFAGRYVAVGGENFVSNIKLVRGRPSIRNKGRRLSNSNNLCVIA